MGRLQTLIRDEVEVRKTSTFESLRWELYGKTVASEGRLPDAWNISFTRAYKKLAAANVIEVETRRFASIDEWERHFPSKSLENEVRQLRLKFLPVLATWLREDKRAHYSSAENERFILSGGRAHHQLFWKDKVPPALIGKWKELEPKLRSALAASDSQPLFMLTARGNQLFRGYRMEVKSSLRENLEAVEERGDLAPDVLAAAKAFVEEASPATTVANITFKSLMRAIADIPTRGAAELNKEAKDHLYEKMPDEVLALPQARKRERSDLAFHDGPVHHSPLMKKVVDHSMFQTFNFLKPAAA